MFFKKVKLSLSIDRVIEDRFYEQVAIEMMNDSINLGTWTRAKANANGDKEKTEALYIKYRVQTLHDAINAVEVLTEVNAKQAHKKTYIEHDNKALKKEREEKELASKQAEQLKIISKIKPLLHKYKDFNVGDESNLRSLQNHYLLHEAVWMSDIKLVTLLLEAGFDPEMENRDGNTAIRLAVGDPDMISLFEKFSRLKIVSV